jgi:MYXO-CTERM domain-containing protein
MDTPVNTVLAHPTLPGVVYAALDVGVMISIDGGATFAPLGGTGLPNAPVWSLAFRKGTSTLVAGTQGRSAWEISFTPTLAVTPASLTFSAATGTPAAAQQLTASNGDKLGSAVRPALTPSATWLHAAAGSGQAGGADTLPISVTVDDLAVGTYDATVRVDGGAAGVVDVPVHVTVVKGTTPAPGKSCGCGIEPRGPGAEAGLVALLALALRRRRRR